ncbi:hypothetical protein BGZ68_008477, partial [Mortierella alpina]
IMKFWFCTLAIFALCSFSVAKETKNSFEEAINIFIEAAFRWFTDDIDSATKEHFQNWDDKNMYLTTKTHADYMYHWAIPFGDVEQGIFYTINKDNKASVRTLINKAKQINGNLKVQLVVVPTGKVWTYIQCNKSYKVKCCVPTTESYLSIVEEGKNFLWNEKSLLAKSDQSSKKCRCQDACPANRVVRD